MRTKAILLGISIACAAAPAALGQSTTPEQRVRATKAIFDSGNQGCIPFTPYATSSKSILAVRCSNGQWFAALLYNFNVIGPFSSVAELQGVTLLKVIQ